MKNTEFNEKVRLIAKQYYSPEIGSIKRSMICKTFREAVMVTHAAVARTKDNAVGKDRLEKKSSKERFGKMSREDI